LKKLSLADPSQGMEKGGEQSSHFRKQSKIVKNDPSDEFFEFDDN